MATSRISELSTGGGAPPGPPQARPQRGQTEVTGSTYLFVPAHPRVAADPEQPPGIGVELQTDAATGELVAAVFTTLDALVDALGDSQPWIVLPAAGLADALRAHGVTRISVDPVMYPNSIRTWTPERLQALEEAVAP